MTNSRRKGATGEREAARYVREHVNVNAERSARNGKTAEDIEHGIPGVHIEVKRYAKFAWWQHVKQARRDAGEKIPTVMMRPNGDTDWYIAIPVARLREFVQRISETENDDE